MRANERDKTKEADLGVLAWRAFASGSLCGIKSSVPHVYPLLQAEAGMQTDGARCSATGPRPGRSKPSQVTPREASLSS
jgi:hypothetical protein